MFAVVAAFGSGVGNLMPLTFDEDVEIGLDVGGFAARLVFTPMEFRLGSRCKMRSSEVGRGWTKPVWT
jgi:hypothetical protein